MMVSFLLHVVNMTLARDAEGARAVTILARDVPVACLSVDKRSP